MAATPWTQRARTSKHLTVHRYAPTPGGDTVVFVTRMGAEACGLKELGSFHKALILQLWAGAAIIVLDVRYTHVTIHSDTHVGDGMRFWTNCFFF